MQTKPRQKSQIL